MGQMTYTRTGIQTPISMFGEWEDMPYFAEGDGTISKNLTSESWNVNVTSLSTDGFARVVSRTVNLVPNKMTMNVYAASTFTKMQSSRFRTVLGHMAEVGILKDGVDFERRGSSVTGKKRIWVNEATATKVKEYDSMVPKRNRTTFSIQESSTNEPSSNDGFGVFDSAITNEDIIQFSMKLLRAGRKKTAMIILNEEIA